MNAVIVSSFCFLYDDYYMYFNVKFYTTIITIYFLTVPVLKAYVYRTYKEMMYYNKVCKKGMSVVNTA